MPNTLPQRCWVGITCVKNVYGASITSVKVVLLCTPLWGILQTSVQKPSSSPRFTPLVVPAIIHTSISTLTAVFSDLYPLSTAPIIRNSN